MSLACPIATIPSSRTVAVGGRRGEALGQGGKDSAVDDAEGLEVPRLDRDAGAGVVGIEIEPLDADLLGEAVGRDLGLGHAAAP